MNIKNMTLIGMMTAVICIIAPISMPLPFTLVPISLSPFAVYLVAAIMGAKRGALCVLLYLAVGAVGVPVFSGWSGGIQKIIGPTGGYLVSYIIVALIVGYLVSKNPHNIRVYFVAMVIGLIVCYIGGSGWYAYIQGISIHAAVTGAVLPFIPGDILKIIMAVLIAYPLKNRLGSLLQEEVI